MFLGANGLLRDVSELGVTLEEYPLEEYRDAAEFRAAAGMEGADLEGAASTLSFAPWSAVRRIVLQD
jgi:hypothetical protein